MKLVDNRIRLKKLIQIYNCEEILIVTSLCYNNSFKPVSTKMTYCLYFFRSIDVALQLLRVITGCFEQESSVRCLIGNKE